MNYHPSRWPLWVWAGVCVLGGLLTSCAAYGAGELAYYVGQRAGLLP